jgi:hypothetical protein
MTLRAHTVPLLVALIRWGAPEVHAQHPNVFRGIVVAEVGKAPIPGAEVIIDGRTMHTDSLGRFRFASVLPGEADVRVRRVGYRTLQRLLDIPPDSQEVIIAMTRSAQVLSGIEVSGAAAPISPGLRAFEERRAMGIGRFLTRDQIARVEYRRMSDIVRTLPGVRMITKPTDGGGIFVATSRGQGSIEAPPPPGMAPGGRTPQSLGLAPNYCLASVYIDGTAVFRGGHEEPPFNINSLNAVAIEAMEYYAGPSQIPAQYNSTSGTCAVLLIWTRLK